MNAAHERQPLSDLVEDARIWDARISEEQALPSDLTFSHDGLSVAEGRQLRVSEGAWEKMLAKVKAPVGYFEKRTLSLRAAALQEHLIEGAFGRQPRLVFRDGLLSTIARSELVDLTFAEVLQAALDTCEQRNESLFVAKIGGNEERMELVLLSSSQVADVRPGDVVQAGIEIVHERYGIAATQIQAFVYRLVCANGLMRRECSSHDDIVQTRRLPVTLAGARELQMEQIRRLVHQALQGLQSQLEELRRTSERPADVPELLLRWIQRARISPRNLMPRLLDAWRQEGSEPTHYGAVNALTRVGTHDQSLSTRQRRVLASLGGLLAFSNVHICPRCFSVLGNGRDEVDDAT